MKLVLALLPVALLIGGTASAAPCHDSNGRFIACPPPVAAATCRNAKGRFVKCASVAAAPTSGSSGH